MFIMARVELSSHSFIAQNFNWPEQSNSGVFGRMYKSGNNNI